jgi:predicted nucleic acid-binding protein
VIEQIYECRYLKDNKYLELAVSAKAECIVTGDDDLLVLNPWRGIEILTVQEFLGSK